MSDKYKETGINDPIMRCQGCAAIVHRDWIHKQGRCHSCGNLRFIPVSVIKEDEMEKLKDGTLDLEVGDYVIPPEFLALFEGAGDGV